MKHARADYNERIQDSANLIPEDEPVFLFRAQDALAPVALDEYARVVEAELAEYDCMVRTERRNVARYEELIANPDKIKDSEFSTLNPQIVHTSLAASKDRLQRYTEKADKLADVAAKTRAHARLFRQWTSKKMPDC